MNSANQNTMALDLLRSLTEQGFWGNLSLRFQNGQVVHITKEESIQTTEQGPKNRKSYDQHSN